MKVNSKWLHRLWKKRPLTNREEDSEKRRRISSPMQRPADAPKEDEVQDELNGDRSEFAMSTTDQGESSNAKQDEAADQGGSFHALPNQDEPPMVASSSRPSAHHGGSSNVSESTEITMAVVANPAPQSPAASQVSMSSTGNRRLRSRATHLVWQSVFCSHCNYEYGQYKYDPSPGARDEPTWDYRVANQEGLEFLFC